MGKELKIFWVLVVALAIAAAQVGCGKKGPPVAPKPKRTSALRHVLAYHLDETRSEIFLKSPSARG